MLKHDLDNAAPASPRKKNAPCTRESWATTGSQPHAALSASSQHRRAGAEAGSRQHPSHSANLDTATPLGSTAGPRASSSGNSWEAFPPLNIPWGLLE